MKENEYEKNDWKDAAGMAMVGLIRKMTVVLPMIAGAAAAGLLLQMAVSGPFEFTCKGVPQKRQWDLPTEELNVTEPQISFPKMAPPMAEPMRSAPKAE